VFSPDGLWLVFQSDETGRFEVYVVSFPELGAKRQVSLNGGTWAQWSAQSNEVFYRAPNGDVMVVPIVSEENSLRSGTPRLLFRDSESSFPAFAATPDGQHFVLFEANPDALAREIYVILNWFTELRAGGSTNRRH